MISNLLFHRINPVREKLWDPIDVKLFDKCIHYISKNYEVVLIEDLMTNLQKPSKKKYATISFDDGYKDNIEYAAPILKKYNCKASFYVVTDCIDKNIPTWTHQLEHNFLKTNINEIEINYDFLPPEYHVTVLLTAQSRLEYIKKLKPYLKKLTHDQRETVLNKVKETYTDVEYPKLMMTWQDLSELKNDGHYIGSHTVSHPMLGTITHEDTIKNELFLSAQRIQSNLGHFPLTISYPVGSYNETTIKLSKEAGYKLGLAVKQNIYYPEKDGIFEIPRIELGNESWIKTLLRITNVLEDLKKIARYRR